LVFDVRVCLFCLVTCGCIRPLGSRSYYLLSSR
jgi:hypothetical protein